MTSYNDYTYISFGKCTSRIFLGGTRSIARISYGNVAGWLSVTAGIVSK